MRRAVSALSSISRIVAAIGVLLPELATDVAQSAARRDGFTR